MDEIDPKVKQTSEEIKDMLLTRLRETVTLAEKIWGDKVQMTQVLILVDSKKDEPVGCHVTASQYESPNLYIISAMALQHRAEMMTASAAEQGATLQ